MKLDGFTGSSFPMIARVTLYQSKSFIVKIELVSFRIAFFFSCQQVFKKFIRIIVIVVIIINAVLKNGFCNAKF